MTNSSYYHHILSLIAKYLRKFLPVNCSHHYIHVHAPLVKRVYSECSPLLRLIKVINTLKHDENDTILRKITEKSHSYNGFAFKF